jgi:putative glutamine amidotransferase
MKPVVGIASSLYVDREEHVKNPLKIGAEADYIQALLQAGAVPVLIPVLENEEDIKDILIRLDGIVLIGGGDIDPAFYNQTPTEELRGVNPAIDRFYMHLLYLANQLHIPALGICKGMQAMNVAFGGTLIQNLECVHVQDCSRSQCSHCALIQAGSALNALLKKDVIQVNSFHHQAIKDVAPGFRVSARSDDGTIEAIEKKQGAWMYGVQWHPEMLAAGGDADSRRLFSQFVKACMRPASQPCEI